MSAAQTEPGGTGMTTHARGQDTPGRAAYHQRERLVAAMTVLAAEQGWQNVTVEMVCDRATISKRTFYAQSSPIARTASSWRCSGRSSGSSTAWRGRWSSPATTGRRAPVRRSARSTSTWMPIACARG